MRALARILVVIGILNFASFWIISLLLGGDATGTKIVDGKYFVSEHGRQREVSRAVYEYSLFHARSVWVTHPLALIGICLLLQENQEQKTKPAA